MNWKIYHLQALEYHFVTDVSRFVSKHPLTEMCFNHTCWIRFFDMDVFFSGYVKALGGLRLQASNFPKFLEVGWYVKIRWCSVMGPTLLGWLMEVIVTIVSKLGYNPTYGTKSTYLYRGELIH